MKALPPERDELLRRVPLLRECSPEELARIDELIDDIEVPPGEVLTKEGDGRARESFLILDGEAEVVIGGRVIARLEPGDLFGEMTALDDEPRSATVTASTPMYLFVLEAGDLHRVLELDGIARHVLGKAVLRLRNTIQSVEPHEAETGSGG